MDNYQLFTEEMAIEYVKKHTTIFSESDQLRAKVFDGSRQSVDGLCNIIVLIESTTSNKSVVLKQVLPYVRALKDDGILIPLTLDRMHTEVNYAKLLDKIVPNGVPKIHLWNEDDNIMVMEDLSHMGILRNALIMMENFPFLADQLGQFLGRSAFYTSELFLTPKEKSVLEHLFELRNNGNIFIALMFDETFIHYKNKEFDPQLENDIAAVCEDLYVIREVLELRKTFIDHKQCLIHTDLHTSNVFVDNENMKIFDAEYAHYGPAAYDIGRIMGSILLNYGSLIGLREVEESKRLDYQTYLLDMMKDMYLAFEDSIFQACKKHNKSAKWNDYMTSMLEDTVGYIACVSMSRISGVGLTFDYKRINDLNDRMMAQRFIIKLTKILLLKRKEFQTIEDMTKTISDFTLKYKIMNLIEQQLQ